MVNLYPPIIDTYMPAFLILQDKDQSDIFCDIYFSISDYNSLEGISSIWVSVTNQYTNVPVLKEPTGLKKIEVGQIGIDNSRPGDDKYRIRIHGSELIEGWRINEVYKVQLRFCSKIDIKNEMSDIIKNQDYFSEWSTVCLIQGILKPTINFVNLDVATGTETILTSIGNHISGSFDFQNTDSLESYRIKLYEANNSNILLETPYIYTDIHNPNEINYLLKYEFDEDVRYELHFDYKTEKMYEGTQVFTFKIENRVADLLRGKIVVDAEPALGRVKVCASSEDNFFGNLVIRRTSNKSDFKIWEDIHIISITDKQKLNYTWFDYTVESGILYHYCIQKVNNIGGRGNVIKTEQPVMMVFDDMFLVGENRQLNIKFNPQVSSFSRTVVESSIQTIGSKYPFIKRNAHVNYRQFQISGLISHLSDKEEYYYSKDACLPDEIISTFASSEECYGKYFNEYADFNNQNRISDLNDFTLEREFRDKVIDFLYNGKVKLFKSASEGNILIRLMNISLTPNQQVGRMLYTFNATAYEIDDCTVENFDKYGIQTIGEYIDKAVVVSSKQSVFQEDISNNDRLIDLLQRKEVIDLASPTTSSVHSITDVVINFDPVNNTGCAPYAIDLNTMQPSNSGNYIGYLIKINGTPIVVSANGYYHLANVDISDLTFITPHKLQGVKFKVDYIVHEIENINLTTYKESYYNKVGQYEAMVYKNMDILSFIKNQYSYSQGLTYQVLNSLTNLTISIPQGITASFRIAVKGKSDSQEYIIDKNGTGLLSFPGDDCEITELVYTGNNAIHAIFDYNYVLEKGLYSSDEKI